MILPEGVYSGLAEPKPSFSISTATQLMPIVDAWAGGEGVTSRFARTLDAKIMRNLTTPRGVSRTMVLVVFGFCDAVPLTEKGC
jgi:hypothetical protein